MRGSACLLAVQTSLPSSQTALSLLHANGEAHLAARLSQLYVPQYLLSTVTIAATVASGVNLIGEAPHAGRAAATGGGSWRRCFDGRCNGWLNLC